VSDKEERRYTVLRGVRAGWTGFLVERFNTRLLLAFPDGKESLHMEENCIRVDLKRAAQIAAAEGGEE
jgi:hypothetical protein